MWCKFDICLFDRYLNSPPGGENAKHFTLLYLSVWLSSNVSMEAVPAPRLCPVTIKPYDWKLVYFKRKISKDDKNT